jgi:hypothetical protein
MPQALTAAGFTRRLDGWSYARSRDRIARRPRTRDRDLAVGAARDAATRGLHGTVPDGTEGPTLAHACSTNALALPARPVDATAAELTTGRARASVP